MQIFPDATAIVSPKIRIERALQEYQTSSVDNGFLSLMQQLGPVIANANTIIVKTLTYQNQQATLQIRTSTFQTLQQFADHLKNTTLKVQQINAGNINNRVEATFTLTLVGKT